MVETLVAKEAIKEVIKEVIKEAVKEEEVKAKKEEKVYVIPLGGIEEVGKKYDFNSI